MPGQNAAQSAELVTIVRRMEQAARDNRDRYRAYVISREYRVYAGEPRPSSTVLADVTFVPPTTKEFKITQAQGSSRGQTVVRQILESEQQAAKTGQAAGAVSSDNYDFTLEGERRLHDHDCFVLGLTPKRKDQRLVIGHAWVDKSTYLVHRVEGQLARMPSWWIKSADVTLDFTDVSGMWLQTHTTANADVRIFGPHTLQVDAVQIRAGSMVAEKIPPHWWAARRSFRRPQAAIGSFER